MSPGTSLDAVRAFLDGRQRAVVATLNPDGSAHLVVVDYLAHDGRLRLNGRTGRRWVSNLRRNPQATALVHDPNDVQHWVSITGPVELVREGDEPSMEERRRWRDVTATTPMGSTANTGSALTSYRSA